MDEKARRRFEQMYQEYEGTVRRLAYGYNIPVDYIDDIVQDTLDVYKRQSLGNACYYRSYYAAAVCNQKILGI